MSPALMLLMLAHSNPQHFLQLVHGFVQQMQPQQQQGPQGPQNPAQRTQKRPPGSPATQGYKGASNASQSPNQGGYAGPGQSEMTNPGMAFLSMLLGGGQPQMGTPAIGALSGTGMGGAGMIPGIPRGMV